MQHILNQLYLPDRYERLREYLGSDVANLLVQPSKENVQQLRLLADEIITRREGVLVPIHGQTGVGKTTFVMNASQWAPSSFSQSLQHEGKLEYDELTNAVIEFAKQLPADNKKIIPINIDHRENNPPSDAELATLKRFLRTNAANTPVIIFWPETDKSVAEDLSNRYIGIAGKASIDLPITCQGPDKSTWQDIARHTLTLSNNISNLEELGVDAYNYAPSEYHTLGSFLRQISQDFNKQIQQLRAELEKPVSVSIIFASESSTPGVLSQLTSTARYGLLDAHALISVTSNSVIGKWWDARRGLLTRTIVQLNATALCLPPSAAASCIRNFTDSMTLFEDAGYRRYGHLGVFVILVVVMLGSF